MKLPTLSKVANSKQDTLPLKLKKAIKDLEKLEIICLVQTTFDSPL